VFILPLWVPIESAAYIGSPFDSFPAEMLFGHLFGYTINVKFEIIRKALPLSVLFLGIALVIAGLAAGDAEQVFKKAVFICLECMGIG
jgi:hypothetical protein